MASYPNMVLTLPDPSVSIGPTWAQTINDAFNVVDNHDHSDGKGLKVTPSGFNINQDLTFNSNYATSLKAARFTSQTALLAGLSDKNQVYVKDGELYFQDASGTNVQITSGGALNVAGVGGITGLSGTTAAVTYSDITKTFSLTQSAGVSAKLDAGQVTVREEVSGGKGVSLKVATGHGSNLTLTLPGALSNTAFGLCYGSSAGVLAFLDMGAANELLCVNAAGTALEYDRLRLTHIPDGMFTADAAGRAKMADGYVTRAKLEAVGAQTSADIIDTITSTGTIAASSVSITTTTARGVAIMLTPSSTLSATGYLSVSGNSAPEVGFSIARDGTRIAPFKLSEQIPLAAGATNGSVPCSCVYFEDDVAAGTYTYTLQVDFISAGTNFTISRCKLRVREL